jgi:hypothetical protein
LSTRQTYEVRKKFLSLSWFRHISLFKNKIFVTAQFQIIAQRILMRLKNKEEKQNSLNKTEQTFVSKKLLKSMQESLPFLVTRNRHPR